MGPYCKFCGTRCFVHLPSGLPAEVYQAYGSATIIATCTVGQEFEKKKVGYCYSDIMAMKESGNKKAQQQIAVEQSK